MLRSFTEPALVSTTPPSLLFQTFYDSKTPLPLENIDTANQIQDPFAIYFLQHALGSKKWDIFSTSPAIKPRRGMKNDTIVDSLLKVEIMKEVLRSYSPDFSNNARYFTHVWPGSPSGTVSLNCATVLTLSGWSISQFSAWSRRSSAVAILCHYDTRLRDIANAMETRLRAFASSSYVIASALGLDHIFDFITDTDITYLSMTAKSLDVVIEQVRQRAHVGILQFLVGKSSTLEDFLSQKAIVQAEFLSNTGLLQDVLTAFSPIDVNVSQRVLKSAHTPTVSSQASPSLPFTPSTEEDAGNGYSRSKPSSSSFSLRMTRSQPEPLRLSFTRPQGARR